jgi:DNA-binding transcriptional MerR regulator/effector-binding domain-containing protein
MEPRVSIGEFAAAVHLSVKTLRHYHEVGLLEPSEVDPNTGYRYYSYEQIPAAQVIRRLRNLDMPVAELKSVLAAPDPAARHRLILEHLGRLETQLAQTTAAVNELQGLLGQAPRERPVERRTVAPTPALAIHDVVDREDVLAWWHGALGELRATVTAQKLRTAGPPGGLYSTEIFARDRGAATVFVPIEGAVREVGRVRPLVIPGAEIAVVHHHGSLANIDLTYGELGGYVMKREINVDGPLRENYVQGFLDTDDNETWDTEIGWPIFRSDTSSDAPGP